MSSESVTQSGNLVDRIQALVEGAIPGAQVLPVGADCSFTLTVISEAFEGLNTVKRQQKVYQVVSPLITSGEVHALSLKTFTPTEYSAV